MELSELKFLLCTIADELETTVLWFFYISSQKHPTNEQVFEAMTMLDKDGDHKINLSEFEVLAFKMVKMFASE